MMVDAEEAVAARGGQLAGQRGRLADHSLETQHGNTHLFQRRRRRRIYGDVVQRIQPVDRKCL